MSTIASRRVAIATPYAPSSSSAFSRWSVFVLGVAFYAIGVAGLVWWILATAGIVPFTGGPLAIEGRGAAIAFNLGLIALFGVQHAIMARPAFKARWTKIVPAALERSIFTLLAGGLMALAMWLWQPMTEQVWLVEHGVARVALWSLSAFGFAYLFAATFAIDHFELFGLRQIWRNLRGDTTPSPAFQQRFMYRFDRHPIMSGVLIGVWFTPDMRLDHLVLALGLTTFVILGVAIEERDLVRLHGESYRKYRRDVGTLVPSLGLRK